MREIFISRPVLEKLLQDVVYVEDEERLKAVSRRLHMGLANDPSELAKYIIEAAVKDFDGSNEELRYALSVIIKERAMTLDALGCLPDRIDGYRPTGGEGELVKVIDLIRASMTDLDRQQIYVDITDISLGPPMITTRFKTDGDGRDVQVLVDFTPEQVERICSCLVPHDPLSHIIDRIADGTVRGVALVIGDNVAQDDRLATEVEELIRNDILVLCNGIPGRWSLLSPEAAVLAGDGLRRFLSELGNGIKLPPVWNFGTVGNYPRSLLLLTRLGMILGGDLSRFPMLSLVGKGSEMMSPLLVALGSPVKELSAQRYGDVLKELLFKTARDVFGGHLFEEEGKDLIERRRARLSLPHFTYARGEVTLCTEELISSAIIGTRIAVMFADLLLARAIEEHGAQRLAEYPETAYALPSILGWDGQDRPTLANLRELIHSVEVSDALDLPNALAAGEAAMYAAEVIEALRYLDDDSPYHGTPYCGFIPDKVLRELGIAFVDDTIPACAVIMGEAEDPKGLLKVVRDCQSRGMLIIAVDEVVRQLREMGVNMGLDMMLYPVGEFTQAVHGLNFAIRAALSFGNVQGGDRERLSKYLERRPKVFVVQMGPLDSVRAAVAFAALLNGAAIITDQALEEVPGKLVVQRDCAKVVQTAIETRGIEVKLAPVDLPVAYGPAFEGELIRRPDTYVEAGGASKTLAYEILRDRDEGSVEDGKVELIGPDVDTMEEGASTPLAILVDVYGKRMEEDFEAVIERRIHQFLNYAQGAWHTGQRDLIWLRLSKEAVAAGLRLRDIGEILVVKLKEEFGTIISRVQVTIVTDENEALRHIDEARRAYAARDARIAGLTDESVETFYTCTLCQSFAPDHVCIVTPERLGLCGAVNWLDAKASSEIAPAGPNRPIAKGEVIDPERGEWQGVNEAVTEHSHHNVQRMCMYTLMEAPMTACGCFEAIVAMTADMQGMIIVNREYASMTPIGMKFSTLAGSIGGGKQTPGFIGIGRKYITSKKFIPADGGFLRIAWMPKALKDAMRDGLQRRAEELGVPDFLDMIADEEITTDAAGLMEWMAKVDHPALRMPPLL